MTWEYAQMSHEVHEAGGLVAYKLKLVFEGYIAGLSKGRVQGAIGGVAGTLAVCGICKGGKALYAWFQEKRRAEAQPLAQAQESPLLPAAEEPTAQEQPALPQAECEQQTDQGRVRAWLALHLPARLKNAVGLSN